MIKKLVLFIFALLVIVIPVNCLAFSNEPNGFRNLSWGETMGNVIQKGYNLTYSGEFAGCASYTTNLQYNYEYGLPINSCNFYFVNVNGEYYLEGVTLFLNGYQNAFSNLGNVLTQQYGSPSEVNTWKGNNTTIYIKDDVYQNNILVMICNTFTLNNIMLPATNNQSMYIQNRENTVQEQLNAAKNLTPEELLDNPVRVVTPDDFYQRVYQRLNKKGMQEEYARQMASDMTMQYEARYNVKFN